MINIYTIRRIYKCLESNKSRSFTCKEINIEANINSSNTKEVLDLLVFMGVVNKFYYKGDRFQFRKVKDTYILDTTEDNFKQR